MRPYGFGFRDVSAADDAVAGPAWAEAGLDVLGVLSPVLPPAAADERSAQAATVVLKITTANPATILLCI